MRMVVLLVLSVCSTDVQAMDGADRLKLNLRILGAEVAGAQHDFRMTGSGRVGGTVAHVLEIPAAYVMGGGGGGLRYKATFQRRFYLTLDAGGSAGIGDEGDPFGSYRFMGTAGCRYFSSRFLAMSAEAQGGIGSYSLLPFPRATLGHTVTFSPIASEHVSWDIDWQLTAGALAVMPTAGTSLSTSLTLQLWKVYAGVEGGVSGEVLIAGLANSASGSAQLKGFLGVRL